MGINQKLGILLLMPATLALGQTPCADPSACAPQNPVSLRSIYEVVNPTRDGTTVVYRLNSVPSPKAPVYIAIRGKELRRGTDYLITGRDLTLSEPFQSSPMDDIQAAYAIETTSDIQPKRPEVDQPANGTTSAILERYLQESLEAASSSTPPDGNANVVTSMSSIRPRTTKRSTEPTSLRMLAAAVDRSTPAPRQVQRHAKRKTVVEESGTGFDGYGDSQIKGPFDLLATSVDESATGAPSVGPNIVEPTASTRNIKPSKMPRSLTMLNAVISDRK